MRKYNTKNILVLSCISLIALALLFVGWTFLAENKAISYEENVKTTSADVNIEEKRRVDLVYNLADCVKQYDDHESDTLKELAKSMQSSNNKEASTVVNAVTYAYPELKSNENYKQLQQELALTENRIANNRKAYNNAVTKYKRYTRKLPTRLFLKLRGYNIVDFERTQYNISDDAPNDLFGSK